MHRVLIRPLPVLLLGVLAACSGCNKEKSALRTADAFAQRGQYEEAERALVRAIGRRGGSAALYAKVGELSEQQGRWGGAVWAYQEAAKLAPQNPSIQTRLGILELNLGSQFFQYRSNAFYRSTIALKKEPSKGEAQWLAAEASVTAAQVQEALQVLSTLPPPAKNTPDFHAAFGLLLFKQGNTNAADQEFKTALQLDPKSSSAWFGMAYLANTRRDEAAALDALKKSSEFAAPRSFASLRYPENLIRMGKPERLQQARAFLKEHTSRTPNFVPPWLLLAQLDKMDRKTLPDAIADLDKVLSIDPGSYEAYILRGETFVAMGDLTNAVSNFEKMASAFPNQPDARLKLAQVRVGAGQVAAAFASIDEALTLVYSQTNAASGRTNQPLTLNSDYVNAILLRATLNLARSNSANEIIPLENIAREDTNYLREPVRLKLAEAYFQQGRGDNALILVKDTEKVLSNAPAWQNEAAKVLLKYGQAGEAARIFTNLATRFPTNIDVLKSSARALESLGRTNEARLFFERNVELQPDSFQAIEGATQADLGLQRFADAEARIAEHLQKQPSAELWMLMARVHQFKAGARTNKSEVSAELQSVEDAFRKAIELKPDYIQAHLELAALLRATDRPEQALSVLTPLTTKPAERLVQGGIWFQIGALQESRKSYEDAAKAYLTAVDLNPNQPIALNNLACLFADRLNQQDRALEYAQRAYDLHSTNALIAASVADTLGWARYKRGDFAGARNYLDEGVRKVLSLPERDRNVQSVAELHYHLGMAQYMLGAERDAKTTLNSALDLVTRNNLVISWKSEAEAAMRVLNFDPKSASPETVAFLKQRVSENSKDGAALLRLAGCQQSSGDAEGALKNLEAVILLNPNSAEAFFRAAQLYSARPADAQKAMDYAKRARTLDSTDPAIAHLLGRLVYKTGDYRWASTLLNEAVRNPGLSSNPQVLLDYASASYSVGQTEDAQSSLQKALQSSAPFDKAEEARSFLACTFASTNVAAAQAYLPQAQKLLSSDANDLPALFVQARALEARPKEGLEAYTRLMDKYPLFVPAARQFALLSLRDPADAQRTLAAAQKAREAFPQDSELLATIEIARHRLKQKPDQIQLQRLITAGLPPDLKQEAERVLREVQSAAKK